MPIQQFYIKLFSASNGKVEYGLANYHSELDLKEAAPFTLLDEEIHGLKSVVWPGRSQVISQSFFVVSYINHIEIILY